MEDCTSVTALQRFREILPPRICPRGTFPNPSHVLDWRRFTSDVSVEYYTEERHVLCSFTPDIPMMTNLSSVGKQTKDRDYTKWVDELDSISNDHYVFISEEGRDELSFSASLTSGVSSHQPCLDGAFGQCSPMATRQHSQITRRAFPVTP